MLDSLVSNFIEVTFSDPENFLKIKETLTRIGVPSHKTKTLWQSCHILHKKGKYYIVHFKELFLLDGRASSLTDEDVARRNTVAALLAQWGLLEIVTPSLIENQVPLSSIKVLSFPEKFDWKLVSKYNIGVRH